MQIYQDYYEKQKDKFYLDSLYILKCREGFQ